MAAASCSSVVQHLNLRNCGFGKTGASSRISNKLEQNKINADKNNSVAEPEPPLFGRSRSCIATPVDKQNSSTIEFKSTYFQKFFILTCLQFVPGTGISQIRKITLMLFLDLQH